MICEGIDVIKARRPNNDTDGYALDAVAVQSQLC